MSSRRIAVFALLLATALAGPASAQLRDNPGTATTMLRPGEYRLMSTSPVDWKGSRYSAHDVTTVALEPIVVPGAGGRTRVGVSIAVAR